LPGEAKAGAAPIASVAAAAARSRFFMTLSFRLGESRLSVALVMMHVSFRHYCWLMKDYSFLLVFTLTK
jgi:hypothetical protein